ncbi:hypothetical protein V8C26DRAFT_325480 [Trichoderma gracile]
MVRYLPIRRCDPHHAVLHVDKSKGKNKAAARRGKATPTQRRTRQSPPTYLLTHCSLHQPFTHLSFAHKYCMVKYIAETCFPPLRSAEFPISSAVAGFDLIASSQQTCVGVVLPILTKAVSLLTRAVVLLPNFEHKSLHLIFPIRTLRFARNRAPFFVPPTSSLCTVIGGTSERSAHAGQGFGLDFGDGAGWRW